MRYLISEHNCNLVKYGTTPLHLACNGGHLDVVEYLIDELGCNPHIADEQQLTPLHYASAGGHLHVMRYLISKHNCNPQCVGNHGPTPLHLACLFGDLYIVKYLIHEQNCPCDPECSFNGLLMKNTLNKLGLSLVAPLVDFGYQIIGTEGFTPLHFACMKGNTNVAKYLITNCNCNLFHSTNSGFTPYDFAQMLGHLEIVNLVSNIPGSGTGSGTGISRIMNTVMQGMVGSVAPHSLGDISANINPTFTPLHWACCTGNLEAVKLYINRFNIHSSSTWMFGITPLDLACQMGNLEIVKYLVIECGCDPKCVAQGGSTSLHYACTMGQLEVVKYLITQCKCDPTLITKEGFTLLHCACSQGHLEVVKYLVTQCKCDPMHIIGDGCTQLHSGNVRYLNKIPKMFDAYIYPLSVEELAKAFLSNISSMHLTALHVACSKGHLEIVKYLITECHCNPNSCGSPITPLGCALVGKHLEIIHYLMTECKCNFGYHPMLFFDFVKQQCGGLDILALMELFELNDMYSSPICMASSLGDLETVKVICNYTPREETVAPLAAACLRGEYDVARFLLTVCEYSQLDIFIALEAACTGGEMDIIKYLIPQCSENLSDLLFVSCLHGHLNVVKFLIDECDCDPHNTDEDGLTPLHGTCTDAKYMLHELVEVYNLDLEGNANSNVTNIKKQGVLFYIWQTINYPIMLFLQLMSTFKSAATVPEVTCPDATPRIDRGHSRSQLELKSHKFDIFKYLVVEQKCATQCKDKNGHTPLHYACESGQLDIVQYLYREKLSDLVHTTLSGDTPLHIACKSSQVEITQFLLSTGDCDPLCKNAEGMTPLEIATSAEITELLDHFCNGNYPLESVVKVFVLGDPLAGKSSMVQALQSNPGFISSLIGRFQKIKGVRQQTAGIDSISFSSDDFGNVVIYDFAGQREFHTSHAAFLQNSSPQLAGIFVVVTNIAQCESDICQSLQYWVSFILECCAHTEMKPHIIIVGSHEDQLDGGSVDQIHSLFDKAVFSKHESIQFYEPKGIVHLDCTRPVSPGLDLLRYHLEESCNSIREHAGRIDQRCYVLHRYVQKFYTGVHECTLESISKGLEGNSHLLPSNPTELLPLFQTLHDKGQVLLLRNKQNPDKSWVITDIAALLEKVIGSIFAPPDFPTHISLGSTGVVSKSKIREVFPDLNTDMIIGFLEHFEFGHRVEPDWINLSELEPTPMVDDEYYLFPALVKSNRPLHESHKRSYCCCWLIHSVEHQFFTTRFLHVLLLRLEFLFSQPQDDDSILSSTKTEDPAVRRRCRIWKNGITWHDANGVSIFFEVRDLKIVALSMTCMDDSRIHCVILRSQLIQTILKLKREFCARVSTKEFIVEVANDSPLQAVDECPSHNINDLSSRISTRSADDNPDMTLINPADGSQGKRISELFYFEPYALLTPDLIAKLFAKDNGKQAVSHDFITQLAQWMYPSCDALLQVLKPSPQVLNKKCEDIRDSPLGEVSKQQLMCEHILEVWVEQQTSATYRNLRRQLNRYSIFCGRNPLNLVCTCCSASLCPINSGIGSSLQ